MIDKLHSIDPIKNLQNTQKTRKTERVEAEDSISLSPKAQKLSEIYFAMEAVKSAPNIRQEKVAEVTKKFEDPSYIEKVLDLTADKILDSFGF